MSNFLAYLKAVFLHLLVTEKALFKSSTMYLSLFLAAAPQLLPQIQADFPTYAPYLPHILQAKGMGWIAVAIAVCRLRSMLKGVQVQS